MPSQNPPPIYTLLQELLSWTLDHTAGFPKASRFTFGQRIDNLTLDGIECVIEALYLPPAEKRTRLVRLNLILEKLRVFWRLVHGRTWISQRQLFFVIQKIDEIGRMTGAWLKSLPPAAGDSRRDFKP